MAERDPAEKRFFTIQMLRLGGTLAAVYAILVIGDVAPWPDGLPPFLAYVIFVIGLVDAVLVPVLLTKAWRSLEDEDDR